MKSSDMADKYDKVLDRHSAYEILSQKAQAAAVEAESVERQSQEQPSMEREYQSPRRYTGHRVSRSSFRMTRSRDTFGSALSEAVIIELKGTTGRRLVRGILGGLFKGR